MKYFNWIRSIFIMAFMWTCTMVYSGWSTPTFFSVEMWTNGFYFFTILYIISIVASNIKTYSPEEAKVRLENSLPVFVESIYSTGMVIVLALTGHFVWAAIYVLLSGFELLYREKLTKISKNIY